MKEEKEAFCNSVTVEVKAIGLLDTPQICWEFFIKKVREFLDRLSRFWRICLSSRVLRHCARYLILLILHCRWGGIYTSCCVLVQLERNLQYAHGNSQHLWVNWHTITFIHGRKRFALLQAHPRMARLHNDIHHQRLPVRLNHWRRAESCSVIQACEKWDHQLCLTYRWLLRGLHVR